MYYFESRIRFSETGRDRKLTVPMLLNYFQDCSTQQSEDLGVGMDYLEARNAAWVLNFWQVDIFRRPALGERVSIGTQPYEFKGVLGFRNYIMKDEKGEKLAVANTIYTLLNMEKHIPFKPDERIREAYQLSERLDMEYLPRKIGFPEGGEKADAISVARHHIDTNDHVNNVQYVDMAVDLLPSGYQVKRILASYHISAVRGDVIYPRTHMMDHSFGVDLLREDGKSFCKVQFFDEI